MDTITAFFPKLGHFFPISKKNRGDLPPPPPSSYAPELKVFRSNFMCKVANKRLNVYDLVEEVGRKKEATSFPLLSCESSVSVRENLHKKIMLIYALWRHLSGSSMLSLIFNLILAKKMN